MARVDGPTTRTESVNLGRGAIETPMGAPKPRLTGSEASVVSLYGEARSETLFAPGSVTHGEMPGQRMVAKGDTLSSFHTVFVGDARDAKPT